MLAEDEKLKVGIEGRGKPAEYGVSKATPKEQPNLIFYFRFGEHGARGAALPS